MHDKPWISQSPPRDLEELCNCNSVPAEYRQESPQRTKYRTCFSSNHSLLKRLERENIVTEIVPNNLHKKNQKSDYIERIPFRSSNTFDVTCQGRVLSYYVISFILIRRIRFHNHKGRSSSSYMIFAFGPSFSAILFQLFSISTIWWFGHFSLSSSLPAAVRVKVTDGD